MDKVLLFLNPKSRSGAMALSDTREALESMQLTIIEGGEGDPNQLIRQHASGLKYVIVGGGDGSLNRVLPGLMETQVPLVVLPLGTANNLARTFGIPTEIKAALLLMRGGIEKRVDVGVINGIPFLTVAGLGLSTEVNRNVSPRLKRALGVGAFVLTAFRMAMQMNPFRAEIVVDGAKPIFTKSWQISVCNGKHYGSGLTIEPNATLDDAKLHLLSTEVKKWWHSLTMVSSFMTGKYKSEDAISLITGREIIVQTRRTFSVDVDGDIQTTTPITCQVQPKALTLVVPPDAVP